MKSILLGVFAAALTACSSTAPLSGPAANSPIALLPSGPTKGTLFTYYQPKAHSKWKANWTAPLDMTGVSWNDNRTVTAISRSHVVMAAHFMRGGSTAAMFHDRDGNPHERYITEARVLSPVGDIAIGKLNLPLPPSIKRYAFANASDVTIGQAVLTTDQTLTVSIHEIAAIQGAMIGFRYNSTLPPVYRRNLIVGDSGHPSFTLKNGEMLLVETHTTGGAGAGPFYGDPAVQSAIRSAMADLGN